MSLADYEDFFYRACLCDRDDPVAAWQQQSEEIRRLADWMEGKEEVHIQGPGTDLRLNVVGAKVRGRGGKAQHARRRVLHRAGRGLGHRRGDLQLPGGLRRPRGGRA